MPGDGVDLLGKDCMENAPQEDVQVSEQEEKHRHLFGRIWEKKEKTSTKYCRLRPFWGQLALPVSFLSNCLHPYL